MSSHTARWRPLLPLLPLIIAASIGGTALQGEPEILLSLNVHLVLVPASLIGWLIARQVARAIERTPVTPIARALPGYVALRGKARPMSNRPSLVTPSGHPCVWYHYHSGTGGHDGSFSTRDSVQPFLLVDKTGQCIVLPDGADVTGAHDGGDERYIAPGAALYVVGEWRPVSADTLEQIRNIKPEKARESVTFETEDDAEPVEARGEALLKAASDAAAGAPAAPLALPLVCDPSNHSPFVIAANSNESSHGSWIRLIANGNLAVLLISGGLLAYVLWLGR